MQEKKKKIDYVALLKEKTKDVEDRKKVLKELYENYDKEFKQYAKKAWDQISNTKMKIYLTEETI